MSRELPQVKDRRRGLLEYDAGPQLLPNLQDRQELASSSRNAANINFSPDPDEARQRLQDDNDAGTCYLMAMAYRGKRIDMDKEWAEAWGHACKRTQCDRRCCPKLERAKSVPQSHKAREDGRR
jgi:hypothetical protein